MFTHMRTRRKRKTVVDEYYYSKKTNVNHQSSPVSGNIPHPSPQMSVSGTSQPTNGLGILVMSSATTLPSDVFLPVARRQTLVETNKRNCLC